VSCPRNRSSLFIVIFLCYHLAIADYPLACGSQTRGGIVAVKKTLKIAGLIVVAVIVIVALVLWFKLGDIIETAVETNGPLYTGGPVSLGKVSVSLLRGEAGLRDVVVANPAGYRTTSAFKLDEVSVKLDMGSLAKNTIVIKEIYVDGPEITFEKSLKKSNIAQILENVETAAGRGAQGTEKEESVEEREGKKVIVDHVLIKDAKIRLSTALLIGKTICIPLPRMEINDIGKESDGTSFPEAISHILTALLQNVTKAISAAGKLSVDGVKAVGAAAVEGTDAVTDAAQKVREEAVLGVKTVGDVAATGLSKTGDTAKEFGKGLKEGAGKAGETVGESASKIVKGIGGLLGKRSDEE